MSLRIRSVLLCLALLLVASCDDDDAEPPFSPGTPTTQFTGAFTGAGDGGLMTATISLAAADLSAAVPSSRAARAGSHLVEALGTLSLDSGGNTVNLTGSYNEETDSLSLSGQGYVVRGLYDVSDPVPGITGGFTGPLGPGFFDCAVGGTGSIQVYCGENTRDRLVYERMQVGIGSLAPVFGFIVIDGSTIHFEGTATGPVGGVRSISAAEDLGNGSELLITGTLNTATESMFGSWLIRTGGVPQDSGEWGLGPCLSGTTGPNGRGSGTTSSP